MGGFKYILKRKSLVVMVFFFIGVNFIFSLFDVLIVPLVLSYSKASLLGIASGATSAGLILGAFFMSFWGGTKDRTKGMIGFIFLSAIAIMDGVVRPPSGFVITLASPPSITATHEFVVPKSIPITLPISFPPCATKWNLKQPLFVGSH